MAKDFIPHMCGHNRTHIPTEGCDDCEALEQRVTNLEENTYTKVEVDELIAGVSGGGGFKLVDELPEEGENGYIYLVPIAGGGYEQWIWTDSGWVDLGQKQITLDKQSILTALGYEETTISLTDHDDNEHEITVLKSIV